MPRSLSTPVYSAWLSLLFLPLSAPQTRMANCGSCFWCIIWLVVLLVIGWPVGITLGGLYGLISPLTTCLGLDRLSDLLLEGANLGRTCANNMRHCKPLCWDSTREQLRVRREKSSCLQGAVSVTAPRLDWHTLSATYVTMKVLKVRKMDSAACVNI